MPLAVGGASAGGLAHADRRFFAGTYLLHYDRPAGAYRSVRVHPSQPARAARVDASRDAKQPA